VVFIDRVCLLMYLSPSHSSYIANLAVSLSTSGGYSAGMIERSFGNLIYQTPSTKVSLSNSVAISNIPIRLGIIVNRPSLAIHA
jgi:hypothetical protein